VLEKHAEAVPRNPSAAAPPVELGLTEQLPLCDRESEAVMECEPEDVKLATGEEEPLTVGQGHGVCVAQCVTLLL
jgi:hypothetical protein